ncbi:hypothetical protein [Saccharothrix deserti]|uniref:hypothetical protein n=1 Tax=Saccharothrix deserti TaxID=2593674 RepID=UPI00131D44CD|nr:hypothetical protein [Saccharothrix deserti]
MKGLGRATPGFETTDAETFAEWGVDYLKYDWCRAHINDGLRPEPAFRRMRQALRATGVPVVYSISEYGHFKPWEWAPASRTCGAPPMTWCPRGRPCCPPSTGQVGLDGYARPGAFNDPDMLQVGNGELTYTHAVVRRAALHRRGRLAVTGPGC